MYSRVWNASVGLLTSARRQPYGVRTCSKFILRSENGKYCAGAGGCVIDVLRTLRGLKDLSRRGIANPLTLLPQIFLSRVSGAPYTDLKGKNC